jgi:hypothetical protein
MKKYEFPNKDLKIEFIDTYNKEVTEKRKKEYESKLAKIPTIEEKLKFTETELVEYLKNARAEVLFLSGSVIAEGIQPEGHFFWAHYLNTNIKHLQQQLENQRNIGKRKKYIIKEIALTYILEIYATGKTTPKAPQGNAKKVLENIGESEFNVKGDSFYRAVKDILNVYDVNIEDDLNQISKNWYNAIKEISTKRNKWDIINEYLKTKGIPKG